MYLYLPTKIHLGPSHLVRILEYLELDIELLNFFICGVGIQNDTPDDMDLTYVIRSFILNTTHKRFFRNS